MPFSATANVATSLTLNAFTLINYNALNYDFGNNFSTTTSKFTAPAQGLWHFNACSLIGSLNDQIEIVGSFHVNGVEVLRGSDVWTSCGAGLGEITAHAAMDYLLAAGDLVDFRVFCAQATRQTNGSPYAIFCGHQIA